MTVMSTYLDLMARLVAANERHHHYYGRLGKLFLPLYSRNEVLTEKHKRVELLIYNEAWKAKCEWSRIKKEVEVMEARYPGIREASFAYLC